ncbi:MAG: chemotaxis protein CheX [Gemmatimonadaceae bacterium]|nr:chemotaxis protein CheX [Gemmatimonadaceae bacterium]
MLTNPTTSLSRAATSTFESLAFLVPEELPAIGAELVPLAASASVTWRGPVTGRVVIGVSRGVLRAVAENMLGAHAADDATTQRDALGEVANVVTGNVLPLVAGADAVFRLDAPALADGASFAAHAGETRHALLHLRMDEGDAILAFYAEAAAAVAEAA